MLPHETQFDRTCLVVLNYCISQTILLKHTPWRHVVPVFDDLKPTNASKEVKRKSSFGFFCFFCFFLNVPGEIWRLDICCSILCTVTGHCTASGILADCCKYTFSMFPYDIWQNGVCCAQHVFYQIIKAGMYYRISLVFFCFSWHFKPFFSAFSKRRHTSWLPRPQEFSPYQIACCYRQVFRQVFQQSRIFRCHLLSINGSIHTIKTNERQDL